jgi:polyisoprenoid-binding protein YceI
MDWLTSAGPHRRSNMKSKLLLSLIVQTALAGAAIAQPVNYSVEPTHTFVTWEASHFGVSTSRGRFDKTSGEIVYDAKAKTGKVEVVIDLKSISTGVAPFDAHLRQDDYFDVERFPQARFASSDFRFEGGKLSEVAGQLTMRGVTKPLTLKAKRFACYDSPFLKREVCGGDFEAFVVRSQYGMVHGFPLVVPDDAIRLQIQVEGVRQ